MATDEPPAAVGVPKAYENGAIKMNAKDFFADALNQLQAGSFQDALDALSIAIQLDPDFIEAYAYRGLAYYRLGNYDAAMADYDRSIALWPNLAEVYYFRAILYGQQKEREKAINDYTRAIELKPTLIEAHYFRALNYGAAGKHDKAIEDMKTAAELGYEPAKEFLESHRAKPEWN